MHVKFNSMSQVVYMCSSLLQLDAGRDLSQSEQIHKTTTIFTRNDNLVHPGQFLSVIL